LRMPPGFARRFGSAWTRRVRGEREGLELLWPSLVQSGAPRFPGCAFRIPASFARLPTASLFFPSSPSAFRSVLPPPRRHPAPRPGILPVLSHFAPVWPLRRFVPPPLRTPSPERAAPVHRQETVVAAVFVAAVFGGRELDDPLPVRLPAHGGSFPGHRAGGRRLRIRGFFCQ